MPYTRISATANGREAIDYALGGKDEKGHNNAERRNLYITSVGLFPNQPPSYADQMDVYWKQASSRNKNQIRRIVTSFSEKELDPNDPNSPLIAAEIAREFAKKYYPDRQVLICVQADGVGGKIHTHSLVSNVSMTDLKGCSDDETKFSYVAKGVDEIARNYIELEMDYGDKWDETTNKCKLPNEKISQYVRKLRQDNEAAIARGEELPHYIWEDDLRKRIKDAMSKATSKDDFKNILKDNGVEIEREGDAKRYGKYFTYVLTDTSGFASEDAIPKKLRARSHKLGYNYMPDKLDELIAEKQVNSPEPIVSYSAPAPTEEEIIEEKEQAENMKIFEEWAFRHDYNYYVNGAFDLDAYEKALKAYEARNDEVPEEVTTEPSDSDLGVSEPVIKQPVKAAEVPKKVSESASKKQSHQQELIKKIQDDVAQMGVSLDSIRDDEDYFGS